MTESGAVLVGAFLEGIYRSDHGGVTWTMTSESYGRVVAGGTGGQLYASEDGGETWRMANCSLMPEGYDDLIYPVVVTSSVLAYRHSFERLFRSGDGGVNWSDDPSRDPSFLVLHEGVIYADDGGDIVQSADASAWSFFAETPFFSLEDAAFRGDDIAVASYSGVVVWPDGGQT